MVKAHAGKSTEARWKKLFNLEADGNFLLWKDNRNMNWHIMNEKERKVVEYAGIEFIRSTTK